MRMMPAVDLAAARTRLLRFLSVEGITGQEAAISAEIRKSLIEVGVPARSIRTDDAHRRIPLATETGNLIVRLPGRRKGAEPVLFMCHMDTVPLCAGARPYVSGNRILNRAKTALGGDNRTGCAVLVTLAAELMRTQADFPPLTLLFTVREESGLFGARYLDPKDLGGVRYGFNFDGRLASQATLGAIGASRWEVDIQGKAAHAGVAPEKGISATMILALAMSDIHAKGWFGKVVQGDREGTSNVGVVADRNGHSAGAATNVVTDFVHVKGESRSHDTKFVKAITAAYQQAFAEAARRVQDHEGRTGKVTFTARLDYSPFRLKESAPVVKRALAAVQALGTEPTTKVTNGGLDANWLTEHGIPTVTFGAGQNEIHTVEEYVDLKEFDKGCQLAYLLATGK
jgi:tripeptide aminopeptidase